MDEMTVVLAGVGAVCLTAPSAWTVAREIAGDFSSATWKEQRRGLVASVVGIAVAVASIVRHPVWTILIPLMLFGIVGLAAGAAVGWVTRAPEDRQR